MKHSARLLAAIICLATHIGHLPALAQAGGTKPCSPGRIEKTLADINANHRVSEDDLTIVRFRFLTDELSKRFGESPACIGDKLVWAHENVLKKQFGKDIKLIDFAEAAYKGSRSTGADMNAGEYLVTLGYVIGQQ